MLMFPFNKEISYKASDENICLYFNENPVK